MEFIFTHHARERALHRKIKREWIEKALLNPDKSLEVKHGRKKNVKKINDKKISVVHVVEDQKYIVVTTYWGE